jgi:hypothetical protein
MPAESVDHQPGHTVVDRHDGWVRLSYRRPTPGKSSGEFVRLLYTPAAALDLAEELIRIAHSITPEGSEATHG